MHELSYDLSILEKLGLEAEPVGVAYDFFKPEGIEQLDKKLPLCEMVKEAQITGKAFYMEAANESCAGTDCLGMDTASPTGQTLAWLASA